MTESPGFSLGHGNWSAVEAPRPPLPSFAEPSPWGVSCPTSSTCAIISAYSFGNEGEQGEMILEHRAGRWSTTKFPSSTQGRFQPGEDVTVDSFTCGGPYECAGVGSYFDFGPGVQEGLVIYAGKDGRREFDKAPLPPDAAKDPNVDLYQVSCSRSKCVAVGDYLNPADNTHGLILTERRGRWSALGAPLPAGAREDQRSGLGSVSCTPLGQCTAVGWYRANGQHGGLIERLAGGRWMPEPLKSGDAARISLDQVSCPKRQRCVIAGTIGRRPPGPAPSVWVERGSAWLRHGLALPSDAGWQPAEELSAFSRVYTGLSCMGDGFCAAAGSYRTKKHEDAGYFITGHDQSWKLDPWLPSKSQPESYPWVDGIACTGHDRCSAVGYFYVYTGNEEEPIVPVEPLLQARTAAGWRRIAAPAPSDTLHGSGPYMTDVACAAPGSCIAIGTYDDTAGDQQGMILSRTSSGWRAATMPVPSTVGVPGGVDVAAVGCWKAGYRVALSNYEYIVQELRGRWRSARTRAVAPNINYWIQDNSSFDQNRPMTCPAPAECLAIGYFEDTDGSQQGLIINFAHGTWSWVRAPLPPDARTDGKQTVSLIGLACRPGAGCVVTGTYKDSSGGTRVLVLRGWGRTWAPVSVPPPTTAQPGEGLESYQALVQPVSCAITICAMVAHYEDAQGSWRVALETETDGPWRAVDEIPMPSDYVADGHFDLLDVSCSGQNACTAVGMYDNGNGSGMLVLRWTGAAWMASSVHAPLGWPSPLFGELDYISCWAPAGCAAAGSGYDGKSDRPVLAVLRAGRWHVHSYPAGSHGDNFQIEVLTCYARARCVAVTSDDSGDGRAPLVLELGAGGWSAYHAPLPRGALCTTGCDQRARIVGLSCLHSGWCVSVGSYLNEHAVMQGLIETRTLLASK